MTRLSVSQDLRLRGALDEERKADLFAGECAAGAILDRANEALGMEHRRTAWTELQGRIEDWKGINTETLGDLLLYGTYDVIKFENGKEAPREVGKISHFSIRTRFGITPYTSRTAVADLIRLFFSSQRCLQNRGQSHKERTLEQKLANTNGIHVPVRS